MNRKASFFLNQEFVHRLGFYSLFLIPYFLLIYTTIAGAVHRDYQIGEIHNDFTFQKFLSDPCLTYNDGVRLHPGIIDAKKFTGDLSSCGVDARFSAHLSLLFADRTLDAIYQPSDFPLDTKLCRFAQYTCTTHTSYVLVAQDGILYPGMLTFEGVFHREA